VGSHLPRCRLHSHTRTSPNTTRTALAVHLHIGGKYAFTGWTSAAAVEQVDILVQPTAGKAAQKIEPDPIVASKEQANRLSWLLTLTFSLANIPALSIPCGFLPLASEQAGRELPIGLQIAGRPFDEERVLKVAYAYERHTPWHARRPPL